MTHMLWVIIYDSRSIIISHIIYIEFISIHIGTFVIKINDKINFLVLLFQVLLIYYYYYLS